MANKPKVIHTLIIKIFLMSKAYQTELRGPIQLAESPALKEATEGERDCGHKLENIHLKGVEVDYGKC